MRTRPAHRLTIILACGALLLGCGPRRSTRAALSAQPAGAAAAVTTELIELDGNGFPVGLPATMDDARKNAFVPTSAAEELDDIYGLMALAVVHADWQEPRPKGGVRGHNIGGVLVDETLEVVDWERNSNNAMCNGTQHGEVRTMVKHLNLTGAGDLDGHQIYTSLEPCMMCSGMMMQQKVLRTVYMQTDNGFGKNIERLTIDTSAVPVRFDGKATGRNGYPPAARPVISSMARSEFRQELDVAWRAASRTPKTFLTAWLQTGEAEDIYRRAREKFEHYPLRFGDAKAEATYLVPQNATQPARVVIAKAAKTNAELYASALRLFNDPSSGIIPYVRAAAGKTVLVEAKDNVLATRLLEDPEAMVRADHPPGDTKLPKVPGTSVLVVDGTVNGRRVHQERVRLECR